MIFLDTTTRSLEFLLGGTVTTNQLPFTSHYADLNSSFAVSDVESNNGVSNNITAVTLVAAPGASTFRQVKFLTIFNADTVNATVTLRYNDNATTRVIKKTTLEPDWTLEYSDLTGIKVIDENGSIQESMAGIIPLANGGAAAALTAANGGIVYSGASNLAISAAGSSGQILRSGGAGAPTWSTATFPATATTTGAYLRADGTNWITSTLVLPNAATANRVVYASSLNTLGESANFTFDGTRVTTNNLTITAGIVYLNDTANANMTTGLTINGGTADDQAIAFKSDVAHGITGVVETDTYGDMVPASGSNVGGLAFRGFSSGTTGFLLEGVHTTDNTAKTTLADGAIRVDGFLKSGTTRTGLGADANIVVFRTASTARFIFDAEGSAHADVEWVAFDALDDIRLLTNLERVSTKKSDPIHTKFGSLTNLEKQQKRQELQVLNLAHFEDAPEAEGRVMINMSRFPMLLSGSIRKMADRVVNIEVALTKAGIQIL